MSKKLYLLFLYSFFLGNYLNLRAMVEEVGFEPEEVITTPNIESIKPKMRIGVLRAEASPGITSKIVDTEEPNKLEFFGPDDKSIGISVDIPQVVLKTRTPKDAKLTTISRPGLRGTKIELANGKFVNVFLPDLNTIPEQLTMPAIPGLEGSIPVISQQQVEVIVGQVMQKLQKFNELFEKYKNDLIKIKNDPQFKEIKPILRNAYDMMSSVPFMLQLGNQEIEMLKAKILENLAEKANIVGFEDLNQDIQNLTDNIFVFVDKFIEFLKNLSKHFTQNKIIQELIAD